MQRYCRFRGAHGVHREQLLRAAMQVPNSRLGEVIESKVESRSEEIH
jgi:hypothetical protein